MPNDTQMAAEKYVMKRASNEGITVEDMRGRRKGYDFTFRMKDGRRLNIEVKGSNKKFPGIPDIRTSEFERKKLKADFLILVWPALARTRSLYIIPRDAIRPANLELLHTYRVRGFGKTRLPEFLQPSLKSIL